MSAMTSRNRQLLPFLPAFGLIALGLIAPCVTMGTAHAQDGGLRIAAVVNDEVISFYDLQSRLRLMVFGSGQRPTREAIRQLQPQVIQQLIDEKLKLQETKKRGLSATEAELDEQVKGIEQQARIPAGQLLPGLDADGLKDTFLDQQRAQIAWGKLMGRKVRATYTISEEQIDEEMARIRANAGKPEFQVSDIFLAVVNPAADASVLATAQSIVEQARAGTNFSSLAQQFTESASTGIAGDLGWVQTGQLEPTLEAALQQLQTGEISEPVRTLTGYHVLALRGRRVTAGPDPAKLRLTLAQLRLPLDKTARRSAVEGQMELAAEIAGSARDCKDFETLAVQAGANASTSQPVALAELPRELRDAVASLPAGKATGAVRLPDAAAAAMVCERQDDGGNMPSREDVQRRLFIDRLEAENLRSIRDLRQAANIDRRT